MSASKFRPSSKSNPCPVCGDSSGKCRDNGDVVLCMPLGGTRAGEVVGEYKCIANKGSGWATFKIDNSAEFTEEKRREWETQKLQREREKAREDEERRRRSLSDEARDRGYRALLAQLDLRPEDRADLNRRGFIDAEIEAAGFKSVRANQRLESPLSPALPGVKADGWHLAVSGAGYLCPVSNPDRLILGAQIRLENPIDGNRYRWLSSPGNAVLSLPNGENPLGFYQLSEKPEKIALVDSLGAKPWLAAKTLNAVVIGAAGGQFASAKIQLSQYLQKAQEQAGTKETIIYPDAGDVNNHMVANRWKEVVSTLNSWGYKVKIAWWGQFTKEDCDIDELPIERLGEIQHLSPQAFFNLCPQKLKEEPTKKEAKKPETKGFDSSSNAKTEKISSEKSAENVGLKFNLPRLNFNCFNGDNPEFEEKIRATQRQLRSLSYPSDILINERYFPRELAKQLPKSGLFGIVGGKGVGKSVLLKEIIKLAKEQGIIILSITPRIALGREQAIKWEITWIDEYGEMRTQAQDTSDQIRSLDAAKQRTEEKLKALDYIQTEFFDADLLAKKEQEKLDLQAEIEAISERIYNVNMASIFTLGLCWDSLWKTEDRSMKNSLIVIDEAELGFTHLATSSTCRSNRASLLRVFSEKVKECLMNGGRVILSDADLTDVSIEYVHKLLPIPIKPFIIKNTYKGKESRWAVDFRKGNRGDTLDLLMQRIEAGEYLTITTDSQAEAEALQREILEKYPHLYSLIDTKSGCINPGKKGCGIVRLDSKNAETEAGKEFLRKPNEAILKYQPRILIYTPTMGVGVSIDETTVRHDFARVTPYFDAVFGLFFGVIEPSQCRQQLARIRANVPRIVACAESNRALKGSKSFFPQEVISHMIRYHKYGLSPIEIALDRVDDDADDGEVFEEMKKVFSESWDEKSRCWNNPHLDLYAKLKARNNYSLWNLAPLLIEELEDEGHTVVVIEGDSSDLAKDLKAKKVEIKMEDAEAIAKSEILASTDDARKILNSITSKKEDRDAAKKTLLADELPGIELTADFVFEIESDRRRWLNKQKLFWLYQNPDAAKARDTSHISGKMKKFVKENLSYMPDLVTLLPKVEAIEKCKVFDWIDLDNPEKIYLEDSSDARDFLKNAVSHSQLLSDTLGVTPSNKSQAIKLVNAILDRTGLKLKKVTKHKGDNRYIIDSDVLSSQTRLAVLAALDLRWQIERGEIAEVPAQQGLEYGEEVPILLNIQGDPPHEISDLVESQGVSTSSCADVLSTEEQDIPGDRQPVLTWRGLLCKLRDDLSHLPAFLKSMATQLPFEEILKIDSAPFPIEQGIHGLRWRVWVNSSFGCKCVDMESLEPIGWQMG